MSCTGQEKKKKKRQKTEEGMMAYPISVPHQKLCKYKNILILMLHSNNHEPGQDFSSMPRHHSGQKLLQSDKYPGAIQSRNPVDTANFDSSIPVPAVSNGPTILCVDAA